MEGADLGHENEAGGAGGHMPSLGPLADQQEACEGSRMPLLQCLLSPDHPGPEASLLSDQHMETLKTSDRKTAFTIVEERCPPR